MFVFGFLFPGTTVSVFFGQAALDPSLRRISATVPIRYSSFRADRSTCSTGRVCFAGVQQLMGLFTLLT